jgi:hypothetical protein
MARSGPPATARTRATMGASLRRSPARPRLCQSALLRSPAPPARSPALGPAPLTALDLVLARRPPRTHRPRCPASVARSPAALARLRALAHRAWPHSTHALTWIRLRTRRRAAPLLPRAHRRRGPLLPHAHLDPTRPARSPAAGVAPLLPRARPDLAARSPMRGPAPLVRSPAACVLAAVPCAIV